MQLHRPEYSGILPFIDGGGVVKFLFPGICICFIAAFAYADPYLLSPEEEQYLLDNPEIHFVSQTSYPPFEFIDDSGERQGMCLELVRWLSTEYGFQAIFTDMTFQEAQTAILNGEADVITSFFYSPSRDSLFDFTVPMFEIPARIYTRRGSTGVYSLSDLAGKRVAVQSGDYAIEFLRSEGINCTLVYANNFFDAVSLLQNDEADAVVGDEQIIEFNLYTKNAQEGIVVVGDTLYIGLNCMAVVQGDSLLCSIINKGILHALETGTIKGIASKWRGSPITVSGENSLKYLIHLQVAFGLILIVAILILLWNLRLRHAVERKTKSLKEGEERLDTALDQANLGSWDCTISTGETVNNDRYYIMLGYSPGEIDFSYTGWLKQIHPADRDGLESYLNEYLAEDNGRFETEYRMRTKPGGWIWIHSSGGIAEWDTEGKPLRITGVHQDITRRKLLENKARKAVSDWETTFDALSELIAVIDSEGTVIRVNSTLAIALGMSREECTGLNWNSLMYPDESSEGSLIPSILSGEINPTSQMETYSKRLGGYFDVSIAVSRDFEDGSIRIVHVARDITARKHAEKKQEEMESRVQHSQKLESLGVLAGGIAHDFNNILMSIRGYTDLASSSVEEGGPAFEYLKEINKSVRIASELSGQMLAYSGKGNFVVETVYLNDIIGNIKPMFQISVSRKAVLEYCLGEDLPPVTVDSTQMEQVILNLITNASEAIGSSNGTITVSTGMERTSNPEKTEPDKEQQMYVYLQVDDTGSGMSEEVISKLFEPFFSTKFTGRGLGMAVVHGIVAGHNGFIQVTSEQGVGSSLKIYIPAAKKVNAEKEIVSESEEELSNTTNRNYGILLIDDEKNILFIGKITLEKVGYTVFTAENGEEAVNLYKMKREAIQCIILDLTMPVMDGVECLKELKKIDQGVKVILSSGYNKQDVESKIHLNDIAGYLKKPYSLNALRTAVKEILKN